MFYSKTGFILTIFLFSVLIYCSNKSNEISKDDWDTGIQALGADVGNVSFYYFTKDSTDYHIDFLKMDGKWFTAIIRAENDTFGIVESFIGYLEPKREIFYKSIDSTKFLVGDFERYYNSLLLKDSVWLLIDSIPFWSNLNLEMIWKKSIKNVNEKEWLKESYQGISIGSNK